MTNLKNKATYSKRQRKHLRFYFRTCVHVAATKISKGILLRDPHAYKSCFTFEDSFTTTYLIFITRVAVFGLSSSKLKTTLISDLPAQREISQ